VSTPLVSVILPTQNRLHFLRAAVASVLAQTERDFELLVVDDASTDGTKEWLQQLAGSDSRIRVLRNERPAGGGGARNTGIEASRGTWVAFLDDDDEWLPDKLKRQLAELEKHTDAIACACSFEVHFPSGKTRPFHIPQSVTLRQILSSNVLGGASVCICSRALLLRIGGFDPRLRSSQDHDLWIRLCENGNVAVCPEPLVKYREHDGDRITRRMDSQLRGARRVYFKHRRRMEREARRSHVSYLCFVKSCQPQRGRRSRLRYLALCLRHAPLRAALSLGARSAPQLIRDLLT
jgi:glycosyltransferase involved in cell wall biosynthesis